MPRRHKESGLDVVASMPWPVGIGLGVAGYLACRYGIGFFFEHAGGPILHGMGEQLGPMLAPLGWMVLVLCWIAACVSFFRSRHRRDLLEAQSGLDSISTMSWREFEMLVGEAFRRQGYSVQETGLGGADGGVDLVLRKNGRTELVQCKQWRSRQVSVMVVREIWGLVAHHHAQGAKIVCVGSFTPDAETFARGKHIELITGPALASLVQTAQAGHPSAKGRSAVGATAEPGHPCPRCGGQLVIRSNKVSGNRFVGCSTFPRCRYTAPI